MRFLLPILMFLGAYTPVLSQETRLAPEGHTQPPATIADMAWLAGQWRGTGIEGAVAYESWLPANGGTMVGTFVQETTAGGIMFTEHLYLMEEEGSLVLRLKHFNADLTGWEEKDDMTSFRLVAMEPGAAFFHGLTLRKDGENGLLAAVRMRQKDGSSSELVFRFTRARPEYLGFDCDGTNYEMNKCMGEILDKAQERQADYLSAALARYSDRPDLAAQIKASDARFAEYREAECGAVWEDWKDGTIRTIMSLSCSLSLTDDRTHDIWANWLTYMDSSPPLKPEPGPTR